MAHPLHNFREHDGGNKSRKLWYCAGTAVLICAAGLLCPAAAVAEVVTGLVVVCSIYVGGNTATRWVVGKTGGPPDPAAPRQPAGASGK